MAEAARSLLREAMYTFAPCCSNAYNTQSIGGSRLYFGLIVTYLDSFFSQPGVSAYVPSVGQHSASVQIQIEKQTHQ